MTINTQCKVKKSDVELKDVDNRDRRSLLARFLDSSLYQALSSVISWNWVRSKLIGPKYVGSLRDPEVTTPKGCCTYRRRNRHGSYTAGTHQVWPGKRCPMCKTHYDDIDLIHPPSS